MWFDDLQCTGEEVSLTECEYYLENEEGRSHEDVEFGENNNCFIETESAAVSCGMFRHYKVFKFDILISYQNYVLQIT